MNILIAIKDFLCGKKTYIIGLLMIILGYLQENTPMIMEGLAIITLRMGISKLEK